MPIEIAENLPMELSKMMKEGFWPGYFHGYPHKRAYRHLIGFDPLNVWGETTSVNLYLHVPFCGQRCSFCNLFLIPVAIDKSEDLFDTYTDCLIADLQSYRNGTNLRKLQTVYFGGGTPSVLKLRHISKLMESVHENFIVKDDCEPCIECSPETTTPEYLEGLYRAGIRRVSFGVQSLLQHSLDDMKRPYTPLTVQNLVDAAKNTGLNINLDLIYSLPGESVVDFINGLEKAISLQPENISIYPLAVRERTRYQSQPTSHKSKYECWKIADEMLLSSGYERQTYVRYRRTDSYSSYQQQSEEFGGLETVGIGAGARSYSPWGDYSLDYAVSGVQSKRIINGYLENPLIEREYFGFAMSGNEKFRRRIILGLLGEGVNLTSPKDMRFLFSSEITALVEKLLVREKNGVLELTALGRQYSDIAVSIFESSIVKELRVQHEVR